MSKEKRIREGNAVSVTVVAFILVAIIAYRLFDLCFNQFDEYQKKVIDQLTTEIKVGADRGNIYDSEMNLIAQNYTVYDISISPARINDISEGNKILQIWKTYYPDSTLTNVSEIIADFLSETLEIPKDEIQKKIAKKKSLYATIEKGVEAEVAEKIRDFIAKLELDEEIFVNAASKRYYPYSNLASHVLGFAGSDNNGLYGLEYYYDETLSGSDGKYIIARDAYGKEMPFDYESYVEAIDGNSIVTTIDIRVQAILEKYLKEANETFASTNGVSGIVMNVKTGAVIAMANYPDYNLNEPFKLSEYYQLMLDQTGLEKETDEYSKQLAALRAEMWRNKTVNTLYMPGSTFKVLTVAMSLEEKVSYLNDQFFCQGWHYRPGYGRNIKCHKHSGHGALTLVGGLQESCNPVMMTLAERLGEETFYEYFKNFGYFEKSGIDLAGETSTYFHNKDSFRVADLACASFGQNFGITMIQHLTSLSTAFNGGKLVVPHLLDKVIDENGNVVKQYETTVRRTVMSQETSRAIIDILADATATKQSSKNAYVPGYRIGAKTGTSEKTDKLNEDGEVYLVIGSCVAFAPAEDPEYVILIVNDEPREGSQWGSVNAAPYAAMVLEEILPILGVEPVYTEEELAKLTIEVGNFVGKTKASAEKTIGSLGCEVEFIGTGDKVTAQSPAKNSSFTKGYGKITLYLGTEPDEEEYTVPDVTGMNVAAANQTLINAGFNVKINGAKNFGLGSEVNVLNQYPKAGTKLQKGDVVVITSAHVEGVEE